MRHIHVERHRAGASSYIRDIILGGQDGLVNVLGVILAVAAATTSVKIVLIAGLAATFAESISMAAVAYTSTKAQKAHYQKELEREKWEIRNMPKEEEKEVHEIYYYKGFRGKLLDQIVRKITSNKKTWLQIMMREELGLSDDAESPSKSAAVVGFSALAGSFIPLIPFLLLPVYEGMIISITLSVLVLFISGAIKAKVTVGSWLRSGTEMAAIGMGAAIIGYLIGAGFGVVLS
ncbi:MAG: VIT1/CCC1 transporter family protein [Candidatus Aenigmarchaeota archaeon]|nr:VIT1/CCC1 transporter family protein [Candidatus Aenigmarchaeota archaeon]